MVALLFVLRSIVNVAVWALEIMFLVRAVMSFIMPMATGAIVNFIFVITETLIRPVRKLLSRSRAVATFPIDISFTVAFFLVIIIGRILSTILSYLIFIL